MKFKGFMIILIALAAIFFGYVIVKQNAYIVQDQDAVSVTSALYDVETGDKIEEESNNRYVVEETNDSDTDATIMDTSIFIGMKKSDEFSTTYELSEELSITGEDDEVTTYDAGTEVEERGTIINISAAEEEETTDEEATDEETTDEEATDEETIEE